MVVYLILERNPELSFNATIDMNKVWKNPDSVTL